MKCKATQLKVYGGRTFKEDHMMCRSDKRRFVRNLSCGHKYSFIREHHYRPVKHYRRSWRMDELLFQAKGIVARRVASGPSRYGVFSRVNPEGGVI